MMGVPRGWVGRGSRSHMLKESGYQIREKVFVK